MQNKSPQVDHWAVFDDGRLLFRLPFRVAIVSPDRHLHLDFSRDMVATRQTVLYTPENRPEFRPGILNITGDGKTLLDVNSNYVRVWNLDRAPAPRASLQGWVVATSPDGRLKVEQIHTERPDSLGDFSTHLVGGDLLVKDAATDQLLHRIAVPEGTSGVFPHFAAGSQRLLVQYNDRRTSKKALPAPKGQGADGSPGPKRGGGFGSQTQLITWKLYDTEKWSVVAQGECQGLIGPGFSPYLSLSAAGRWLVEGKGGDSDVIVRDTFTGQVTCEVHLPEGAAVGAYKFDPTDERLAIVTVPNRLAKAWTTSGFGTTQAKPAAPGMFDLRACSIRRRASPFGCGPRSLNAPTLGKRAAAAASAGLEAGLCFICISVRAGESSSASMTARKTFRVCGSGRRRPGKSSRPSPPRLSRSRPDRKGSLTIRQMVVDRGGRRVAVIDGDEVRVWDLETGTLLTTLRGHDSPVSAVCLNTDGTRLFALHAEHRMAERGRVRLSVWDLETARVVFTIQPPDFVLFDRTSRASGTSMSSNDTLEFEADRLSMRRHPVDYTFDGTPVKP